jgi:hypothetical protein
MKKLKTDLIIENHLLFEHEYWMRRILTESPEAEQAFTKLQRLIVPIKTLFVAAPASMPPQLAELVNGKLQGLIEDLIKDRALTPEKVTEIAQTVQTLSREILTLFSPASLLQVIEQINAQTLATGKNEQPLYRLMPYSGFNETWLSLASKVPTVESMKAQLGISSKQLAKAFLDMRYDDLLEFVTDAAQISKQTQGLDQLRKIDAIIQQYAQNTDQRQEIQPMEDEHQQKVTAVQPKQGAITSVEVLSSLRSAWAKVPQHDRDSLPPSVRTAMGSFIQGIKGLDQQQRQG